MTNEQFGALVITLLLCAGMAGPSLSGVERELRRIADALEKLERQR